MLPDNTVLEYITDSAGRRIAKKINGAITKAWLYEGSLRPVAELDSTGTIVSRFVYATGVNVPEYMIRAGVTYRIITDQLGSVRMVVNASTGAVAQELRYDEFGVVTQDTNPGFTPFGFGGGIYDTDTKLVRFGARDYDAETGRWTAKDPIGFNGGDTNLYGYVMADPVNGVDARGTEVYYPEGVNEAVAQEIIHDIFIAVSTDIFDQNAQDFARQANEANTWFDAIVPTINGVIASAWTPETYCKTELTLASGLSAWNLHVAGWEWEFRSGGRLARVAPFGNRSIGNNNAKLPHYHRAVLNPKKPKDSLPGQGYKKHRPWEGGFKW